MDGATLFREAAAFRRSRTRPGATQFFVVAQKQFHGDFIASTHRTTNTAKMTRTNTKSTKKPQSPMVVDGMTRETAGALAAAMKIAECKETSCVPTLSDVEKAKNCASIGGVSTGQAQLLSMRRPLSTAFATLIAQVCSCHIDKTPELLEEEFKDLPGALEEPAEACELAGMAVPDSVEQLRIKNKTKGSRKRELRCSATPMMDSVKDLERVGELCKKVCKMELSQLCAPAAFLCQNRTKNHKELEKMLGTVKVAEIGPTGDETDVTDLESQPGQTRSARARQNKRANTGIISAFARSALNKKQKKEQTTTNAATAKPPPASTTDRPSGQVPVTPPPPTQTGNPNMGANCGGSFGANPCLAAGSFVGHNGMGPNCISPAGVAQGINPAGGWGNVTVGDGSAAAHMWNVNTPAGGMPNMWNAQPSLQKPPMPNFFPTNQAVVNCGPNGCVWWPGRGWVNQMFDHQHDRALCNAEAGQQLENLRTNAVARRVPTQSMINFLRKLSCAQRQLLFIEQLFSFHQTVILCGTCLLCVQFAPGSCRQRFWKQCCVLGV